MLGPSEKINLEERVDVQCVWEPIKENQGTARKEGKEIWGFEEYGSGKGGEEECVRYVGREGSEKMWERGKGGIRHLRELRVTRCKEHETMKGWECGGKILQGTTLYTQASI